MNDKEYAVNKLEDLLIDLKSELKNMEIVNIEKQFLLNSLIKKIEQIIKDVNLFVNIL